MRLDEETKEAITQKRKTSIQVFVRKIVKVRFRFFFVCTEGLRFSRPLFV